MKLSRGQKRCKACKSINAARQRKCVECDTEFKIKKGKLKNEITDWKALCQGDTFRVINGSGPFYLLTRDCGEGKRGERLFIGSKGKFVVRELEHNGISAIRLSSLLSKHEFIYMGKDEYCEELNIYRRAHRIVKIPNTARK